VRSKAHAAILVVALVASACARGAVDRGLGWRRLATDHVRLETDLDRPLAEQAALDLEAADRALTAVFPDCPYGDDEGAMDVIALAHGSDYDAIAPDHTDGYEYGASIGGRNDGFATPARLGLVPSPSRIVLRGSGAGVSAAAIQFFLHHDAHRLAATCLTDAPVWLEEALATYFETLRVHDHTLVVGIAPFHFTFAPGLGDTEGLRVVDVDRRAVAFPSVVMSTTDGEFYDRDQHYRGWRSREGRYVAAWATLHMLMIEGPDDARAGLARYFEDLARPGSEPPTFTAEIAGVTINRDFHVWLHAGRVRTQTVPYDPPSIAVSSVSELSPAEADLLWISLLARIDESDARRELMEHVELASADSATHARAELERVDASGELPSIELLTGLRASDPGDLDVTRVLALRSPDAAAFDALLARPDLRVFDLLAAATAATHFGRMDDARALARTAVHLAPTAWWSHRWRADVLAATGDRDEQSEEILLAHRIDAHHLAYGAIDGPMIRRRTEPRARRTPPWHGLLR
jgi:hypothetical protein